jgi:hypothetical protein
MKVLWARLLSFPQSNLDLSVNSAAKEDLKDQMQLSALDLDK